MALAAGSTLGPFTIFDLLGKGGMASVYKAYEAEVGRYVALKVLPQEVLHLDSYVKRFERDARILARLEHPNIVPLYRYGVDDGIPWMSLRMLPVGSLVDLLKEGRLDRRRIVAILKQVAEALDHAHGNGVIHRDVKPGNVLLDDKDRPYLCDFGIAHLDEATEVLTLTGMMAGSPRYMAPEQSESMDVDHRADIYALGIVAYEMLTGAVPFTAGTAGGLAMKHAHTPPPIPPPEQVPEALIQPVLKALAKDPAERWDSAGAFAAALGHGLDELVTSPTIAGRRELAAMLADAEAAIAEELGELERATALDPHSELVAPVVKRALAGKAESEARTQREQGINRALGKAETALAAGDLSCGGRSRMRRRPLRRLSTRGWRSTSCC